jgi:dephospho-CoA kinase
MGISREAQLIVPKVHPLRFDPVPVICLAGKTGAGKSVVARYLSVFYGFEWLQTRNVVRDLLAADLQLPETKRLYRGDSDLCQMTETDLRLFGACLLDDHQQLPVQLELTRQIRELHGPVVVDSVRELVDVQENQLNGRCALIWFIDCNDSIIKNRVASKSKLGEARLKSASPVDYTAPLMKKAADRILNNNGSLEELRWRIDDTLFKEITLHAH